MGIVQEKSLCDFLQVSLVSSARSGVELCENASVYAYRNVILKMY